MRRQWPGFGARSGSRISSMRPCTVGSSGGSNSILKIAPHSVHLTRTKRPDVFVDIADRPQNIQFWTPPTIWEVLLATNGPDAPQTFSRRSGAAQAANESTNAVEERGSWPNRRSSRSEHACGIVAFI
jgi:hypothetical protein